MKRAEDSYFGGRSQNIGDHKQFRASNCARLMSKLLRDFAEPVLGRK